MRCALEGGQGLLRAIVGVQVELGGEPSDGGRPEVAQGLFGAEVVGVHMGGEVEVFESFAFERANGSRAERELILETMG